MQETPRMDSILESALYYRSLGLVVLPLRRGVKSPSLDAWTGEGPQTEDRIRELFGRHDGNLGILCGSASRLLVLDVDIKYGKIGDKSIEAWEEEHGELPETRVHSTPSGGWQMFYRLPSGVRMKSNRTLLKDVDIQLEGAQVAAPPSVLVGEVGAGGRPQIPGPYTVLHHAPIADAPEALIRALEASAETRTSTRHTDWSPVSRDDETYPERVAMQREGFKSAPLYLEGEGQGNVRYVMLFQELGPGLLLDAGTTFENYAECYDPRLPEKHRWLPNCETEIRHTIGRAYFRPMEKGAKPDETWERCEAERNLGIGAVEPRDPLPPAPPAPDLPEFPLQALPPVLREFVAAEAERTQTPADLAAMLALGCCSAALAGKYDVEVEPGYIEPINIFALVALPPGERKSAVFKSVFAPLKEYEELQAEASIVTRAQAESKLELAEKRLSDLKKEYSRLTTQAEDLEWKGPNERGGAALMREIEEQAARVAGAEVPPEPRMLCDDVTPERLAVLMAEQGGRMCVASAEGTIFQVISGRYSKDGRSSFEVFLQGHAGDPLRVDRQSRPSIYVRNPRLTMALAIQPSIVQGLGANDEMRGQGLLARFLYSFPKSRIGERMIVTPPMALATEQKYQTRIRQLAELPLPEDGRIARLRLSEDARRLHRAFRQRIEPRLREDLEEIRDWASKLAGAIARIAGILSVFENGPTEDVTAQAMTNAIALGEGYLLAHASRAFGAIVTSKSQADAEDLERWLRRAKLPAFTWRDAKRLGPNVLRGDKARLEAAIRELYDQGKLDAVSATEWRVLEPCHI